MLQYMFIDVVVGKRVALGKVDRSVLRSRGIVEALRARRGWGATSGLGATRTNGDADRG